MINNNNNNLLITDESNEIVTDESNEIVTDESNQINQNMVEGFQDNQNQVLANIMDRLDNLEKMIELKKKENNNVHDIILFIIIGVFILFALDSIFKIGKNTI